MLEELLEAIKALTAAIEGMNGDAAPADKTPAKTSGRPRGTTKPAAKPAAGKTKGPSLEDVQDAVRELVAADSDNKTAIKAAIKKIDKTAERVGDFEDSPDKLAKLLTALNALKGDDEDEDQDADDDDDVL